MGRASRRTKQRRAARESGPTQTNRSLGSSAKPSQQGNMNGSSSAGEQHSAGVRLLVNATLPTLRELIFERYPISSPPVCTFTAIPFLRTRRPRDSLDPAMIVFAADPVTLQRRLLDSF